MRCREAGLQGSSEHQPPVILTYAIADLHGANEFLELALDRVAVHAAAAPAGGCTVVFVGDRVDRGPGRRQVIERLMAGPPKGVALVLLEGPPQYSKGWRVVRRKRRSLVGRERRRRDAALLRG